MPVEPASTESGPQRVAGRGAGVDWAIWAATRAFLLAIIAGAIPWPEQVNDLNIYSSWVRTQLLAGRFPAGDQMWQYPPLAAPVFILGELAPGGRLGYAAVFLAFDAAIMAMVSHRAGSTGIGTGRRLWALAPVAVGPLLLARFDVVPSATAVAAVLWAARPLASGALAGIGAWLKLWPALAGLGLARRDLPRGLLGAIAVSLPIAVSMMALTTDPWSFLTGQRDRGLQVEAVTALPFHLARLTGRQVPVVYQYGAHEFVAPGVGLAASVGTVLTVVLVGTVVVARLAGRLEHLRPADVVLAAVLFAIVGSRVFSGQYFVWLLSLAAIALCEPNTRMRTTCGLLIASALATHLIYPWLYSALLDGNPVAIIVQTVRVVTVASATATALWALLKPRGAGS